MSTANANRPHQQWTRQLLYESALLPRPSMLKLFSLPLASGTSFRLALGPHHPLTMRSCFIGTGRGHNRERNCRIRRTSSPLHFVLRLRLQKGGAYLRDTTVLARINAWSLTHSPQPNFCITIPQMMKSSLRIVAKLLVTLAQCEGVCWTTSHLLFSNIV